MTVLVSDGADGAPAPAPDATLGITHCSKPGHSGAEGLLSLWCAPCKEALCRACADKHLDKGHTVLSMDKAGKTAAGAVKAALPALRAGLAHHAALLGQSRQRRWLPQRRPPPLLRAALPPGCT